MSIKLLQSVSNRKATMLTVEFLIIKRLELYANSCARTVHRAGMYPWSTSCISADDVVLYPGDRVLVSTANGQVTLDD